MNFKSLSVTREGGSEVRDGLRIEKEPFLHVLVGSENRDRNFSRISLGEKIRGLYLDKESIEKGSFLKTHEKGTILIVEEAEETAPRVGLLVKAVCGYRGASTISANSTVLASGQVWDSPNGMLGMSEVVLAIAKPGDTFNVFRTGRLYGAPENVIVTVKDDLSFHVIAAEDKEVDEASSSGGEVL